MDHQFFIPQNLVLKSYVSSIWQSSGFPDYKDEIILPSGVIEIIFNFSEKDFDANINGKLLSVKRCFINGYNTKSIALKVPKKHIFFGIRFYPFVIKSLFGFNAGEFLNNVVDIDLLDKPLNNLWNELASNNSFSKRIFVFKKWLFKKTRGVILVKNPIDRFLNNPLQEPYSVKTLSQKLYVSQRHLSRKFYQLTGMNTEEALRYKRYLKSISLMEQPGLSLTQVSYHCNFFDQSHFIKTFKEYTGITPLEYKKTKGGLPGHIFR